MSSGARQHSKSSRNAARNQAPRLAPATLSEYRGVRSLHLGTPWIQGSMRISQPLKLELEYVRRMFACLLLLSQERLEHFERLKAVQLGLGAASITKYCHRVLGMQTTAVEINPTVIEACRRFFHLGPDDEHLLVLQADAAEFVTDPRRQGSADLLFVDLYDHEAASPVLDDLEFYQHCRALLGEQGVMSVNLFGREASFDRSMQRLVRSFGRDHVAYVSPTPQGNAIALAWIQGDLPEREALLARAARLEQRFGLKATPWVKYIRPLSLSMSQPAGAKG